MWFHNPQLLRVELARQRFANYFPSLLTVQKPMPFCRKRVLSADSAVAAETIARTLPGPDSAVAAVHGSNRFAGVHLVHDPMIVFKVWTCSRCSRMQKLHHKTGTSKSWVCGNPGKRCVVRDVWEDGSCDGTMLFNAETTSICPAAVLSHIAASGRSSLS